MSLNKKGNNLWIMVLINLWVNYFRVVFVSNDIYNFRYLEWKVSFLKLCLNVSPVLYQQNRWIYFSWQKVTHRNENEKHNQWILNSVTEYNWNGFFHFSLQFGCIVWEPNKCILYQFSATVWLTFYHLSPVSLNILL
jgi:hypothetical protein